MKDIQHILITTRVKHSKTLNTTEVKPFAFCLSDILTLEDASGEFEGYTAVTLVDFGDTCKYVQIAFKDLATLWNEYLRLDQEYIPITLSSQ